MLQDGGGHGRGPAANGANPADGGIVVTGEIVERFLEWLRLEGLSPESKQYREYERKARDLIGKRLDCETVAEIAARSKRWHELVSRLLRFVGSPRGLGLRGLEQRLRECKPRKQRSGSDTYVPPIEAVKLAGARLRPYPDAYAAWLLLVSSGARLSTITEVLTSFDKSRLACLEDRGICRYHVDYAKGEKLQWALYAPQEAWQTLEKILPLETTYSRLEKLVREKGGIAAKHYRNFALNKMLELGIPESVADFIVGHRPQTVGARHYMALIAQADTHYPRYAKWLRESVLA